MPSVDMQEPPSTIALMGTSGAGKTTLAKELARRMDTIFIEHDAIRHKANWETASEQEIREVIEKRLEGCHRWVIDRVAGDYIWERVDVVLWLDLPLHVKMARATKRSLRRLRTNEELWNGNRESWQGVFLEKDGVLPYLIHSHFRHRRVFPKHPEFHRITRLRTPREVNEWLESTFPVVVSAAARKA